MVQNNIVSGLIPRYLQPRPSKGRPKDSVTFNRLCYSVVCDILLVVMFGCVCSSADATFNRLWYLVVCDIQLFVGFGCVCYSSVATFNRLWYSVVRAVLLFVMFGCVCHQQLRYSIVCGIQL